MKDLTPLGPPSSDRSPFDQVRQVRADGSEFWSARVLMPLLGYTMWHNFTTCIERAMQTAKNQGLDVADNFTEVSKVAGRAGPAQVDFELSRFAAYLVAMNGDPHKSEVAAAQAYFAVQTRAAETAQQQLESANQFDLIRMQAHQILAVVDRIEANEAAIKEASAQAAEATAIALEASAKQDQDHALLEQLGGKLYWYTAAAHARRTGNPTHVAFCQKLGREATRICRERGIEPAQIPDPRFGYVNQYPEEVLDEALRLIL